jgi:hypothetical protein
VFDKSTGGMAREARAKMAREGISLGALLWVTLRSVAAGMYDALRGVVGWSPYYMPIFGEPGPVAAFTDPDSGRHRALFEKAGVRVGVTSSRPASSSAGRSTSRGRLSAFACRCWSVWLSRARDADPQNASDIARQAPPAWS